jgi:hypothetical protein
MKKYLIFLFTACSATAFGQGLSVSKDVEEEGKSISLHFSGTIDGQIIKYDHTFDLSFLDKPQRLALTENRTDSLDLAFPPVPDAPDVPWFSGDGSELMMPEKAPKFSFSKPQENEQNQDVDGKRGFFKEVRYNAEGEMYLHYHFVKNGEDFEYERTLSVKGKSEKDRQQIISETEQELGLSLIK